MERIEVLTLIMRLQPVAASVRLTKMHIEPGQYKGNGNPAFKEAPR
jgi:hypothetical protein